VVGLCGRTSVSIRYERIDKKMNEICVSGKVRGRRYSYSSVRFVESMRSLVFSLIFLSIVPECDSSFAFLLPPFRP
jgi:hypothetical protein